MVRSRRSISKEDASSVLADSGISLSSPPAAAAANDNNNSSSSSADDNEAKCLYAAAGGQTGKAAAVAETATAGYKRNCHSGSSSSSSDDGDDDNDEDYVVDVKPAKRTLRAAKHKTVKKSLQRRANAAVKKPNHDRHEENVKLWKATAAADTPHATPATGTPAKVDDGKEDGPEIETTAAAAAAKKARKAYVCGECQKEFGGNTDLKRHQLIHSNERPYACEQCSKRYRQAVNLKNHITTAHNGHKQFNCAQCPKTFALKERLRLHMRLHSGEKPYACSFCDKCFARGGQLQQHVVTHHKSQLKQHVCAKCSASFSSTANLRAHMERHEQGPDHYCEICNEHFANDVVLRAHVNKLHYKLRQFDCDVCKKTIEDDDLATHMKEHAHVKLHVCEVCKSYFTQKSQYNVHMRMHTGERPYQCRICWQTFAHSSVLKLHIRKHTGEKPFRCLLCKDEVAFSQLAHLKTHMKKIHKQENPYMCEGCNRFFKVKVELQAHVQQCKHCDSNAGDQQSAENQDMQNLSHLRFLLALLIKKISSEQKLHQLGYEKRLIDNVIIASLKLANRKAHDDTSLSAIERMRLNTEEFLNWIVPAKVMQSFQDEKLTVEVILDKIVAMYMKQK